jgi:ubiquinol-cytochrome c reductase cytochrome b subunit
LALLPHGTESYVIVLAPLTAGVVLFALPLLFNKGERSPSRRPWAVAFVIIAVLFIGTLWASGERSPWSPDFNAPPLSAVVQGSSGPIAEGARLFHTKGCEDCHRISGSGGQRGPDLTAVGDRLDADQITIRILNGGTNMPSFAGFLAPTEMNALRAFLQSRDPARQANNSGK